MSRYWVKIFVSLHHFVSLSGSALFSKDNFCIVLLLIFLLHSHLTSPSAFLTPAWQYWSQQSLFVSWKSFSYDSMWNSRCVDVFSEPEVTRLAPYEALQPQDIAHYVQVSTSEAVKCLLPLRSWSSFPLTCLTGFLCLLGLDTS